MKIINLLLLASIMYHVTSIEARPEKLVARQNTMNKTITQITSAKKINRVGNSAQKAVVADTVINNNTNQDIAAPHVTPTENQTNNQVDDTQTTNEENTKPLEKQQIDSIPKEPTNIEPSQQIPPANTMSPADPISSDKDEEQKNTIENNQTPTESQMLTENNQKNDTKDEENILKTLKTIDIQGQHNKMLLTESSMNQLFNNFIYFKNFIVENFTKEKIVHLCVEFIDQIYPKETVVGANILRETSGTLNQKPDENNNAENIPNENIENESDKTQIENQTDMTMNEYTNNQYAYAQENSDTQYQNNINQESDQEDN